MRKVCLVFAGITAALLCGNGAEAQGTGAALDSVGWVGLEVRAPDGSPIETAVVKSGRINMRTDSHGMVRLVLPPGPHILTISRLGFHADTVSLEMRAGLDTLVVVTLVEQATEVAPIVVTTTRTERRMEDEPERVEVLSGEDVDEKSEMRPGDLTVLLSEMSGVRVQTTSPASGAAGLRVQGLRGQYTEVLTDGLPLYGAESTALGILQIPPLDLKQAEVIKGAATALYGPSALGGVVNLISRRPSENRVEQAVLLNQTSRSGSDGTLWLSRRLGERWGYTLVGGAHHQARVDVDHDGWADLPGYDRGEVRPRFSWVGADGRSVLGTLGFMAEDRSAGAINDQATPSMLRDDIDTRRGDGGLIAHFPRGSTAVASIRSAVSGQWQQHRADDPRFGAVPYRDSHSTIFVEATYLKRQGAGSWLLGAAIQRDAYRNRDLENFDYTYSTPSWFGQSTLPLSRRLSASTTARCDVHSRYGTHFSPRVSLLAHAGRAVDARLSAGTGFFAPTPFIEETQAIQLARLAPPRSLVAERARNASFDVTARSGGLETNVTLFATVVDHAVLLEANAGDTTVALVNAARPTRTRGAELFALYNHEPISVTATYAYLRATEVTPETGLRRDVPLDPRHSAALDVAWDEDESGTRVGVELFYTGRQALDHDPHRTTSKPFTTLGVLASQKLGRTLVYVNTDNLTDVRQTRYESLLLPAPGPGGRITVDPWAPLEGRAINAGVRFEF